MVSIATAPLFLPTPEATARLGAWLAAHLRPGDVVLLDGPIGTGKTHLARALIQARLGRMEDVPSPSFTLLQTYEDGRGDIWHADLYRLSHPDEVIELGLEGAFQTAICLVEWPDRLTGLTPPDALRLRLSYHHDGRLVRISGGRPELRAALDRDWRHHA